MRAAMACQTGTGGIRSSFSNALTHAIVSSGYVTPEALVYLIASVLAAIELALAAAPNS
jgi:hypothetical protein